MNVTTWAYLTALQTMQIYEAARHLNIHLMPLLDHQMDFRLHVQDRIREQIFT